MSIASRLAKLESHDSGRCPSCPPPAVVYGNDYYGEARPAVAPSACSTCGRPADVLHLEYVKDFYVRPERVPGDRGGA